MQKAGQAIFNVAMILIFLSLSIPLFAQEHRGISVVSERLALVIGNSAYQTAPLQNPANDADDMSAVLTRLGFNVTLKKNVDRRTFEDEVRHFGRQLRNGGVGLFYFAGHGMQVEGRNYLIPINARIESESDVKYEAVDAGLVLGKMDDAKNQLNIVILDACRNNPFSRNFRTMEQGLSRMDAPTGALIVYATAPGAVAADGPERNGIFTKHLIRHLHTPNLPVEQVLKRVRIDVAAETKQRQIPWESSSLMGDFYFKPENDTKSTKIMTSDKPGTLEQASIQPHVLVPPVVPPIKQPQRRLSIFPMLTPEISHNFNIKNATLYALSEVLVDDRRFDSIQSYYDLKNDLDYKKIDHQFIDEMSTDQIWIKKSFFSSKKEPNIDFVIALANKIGADFIFMNNYYIISSNRQGMYADFYFVEVKQKKIYYQTFECSMYSSYTEVPKFIKAFFRSFKID